MFSRLIFSPIVVFSLALGLEAKLSPFVHQQDNRSSAFFEGVLRGVEEYKFADGRGLTRPGVKVAIDLVGLDTALTGLGFARDHQLSSISRKHSSMRVESYRSVASCSAQSFGERCEFPAGVQTIRFFEPKRIGTDSVRFLMGVYERIPSDLKEYPGTGGAVYEVTAAKGENGWSIISAKVRATA